MIFNKFLYLLIFLILFFSWVECFFLFFDLGVLFLDVRLVCVDVFFVLNVLVIVVGFIGLGILLKFFNDFLLNWRFFLLVFNWFLRLLFVVFFIDIVNLVLINGFFILFFWLCNYGVLLFFIFFSGCFWFFINENKFL